MYNGDFENIQTARRLIELGRYAEARNLLKQTNHPQVPALEHKLHHLLDKTPADSLPVLTPYTLIAGMICGLITTGAIYSAGINYLRSLAACFIFWFVVGVLGADILQRYKYTRNDYYFHINQRWRW